ncbi:hypothetical protein ACIQZB_32575 [Streptomyces sp. NPDC097727]|uniref:hypothetical protein n=1 Tax=Streptomyces sp. NPDC097727 TaxID=3366092 RepID=UPI0037F6322F
MDRLRRIVGLPIGDKDAAARTKPAKTRNALQHYGLTDRARAVEARTAEVLDFLVRFLDEQLLPAFPDEDRQRTTQDMRTIRGGLSRIQASSPDECSGCEPHRNRTVACPGCDRGVPRVWVVEVQEIPARLILGGQHICQGLTGRTGRAAFGQSRARDAGTAAPSAA